MSARTRILRVVVAYDGAEFAGWQRQAGQRTVQGELEAVVTRIEGAHVSVSAAGRTDAGVHAAAQVVSFGLSAVITPERLVRACNATLPTDVRVLSVEEMPDRFHARILARGKTYRYFVWHAPTGAPLLRRTAWHVPQRMSLTALQEAAALFVGEHDFSAFQAQGSDVKSTIRRVWTSTVEPDPVLPPWCAGGDERARLLTFEVSGSGFLRHQVRAMVGTLVLIGKGRLSLADLRRALDGGSRAAAGPTAPAWGLHLWKVHYET